MCNPKAIDPNHFLKALFGKAVEAADPMRIIAQHLPPKPALKAGGRVIVIGAGKASARMAEAVEQEWGISEGLVITRYGYARPCQGIEIVEAAHPVPDKAGLDATNRMLTLLEELSEKDFVLSLISGGASALLVAPAGEITLDQKQALNSALLASGAPIGEINLLRKHLSQVKGGQLAAAAHPAQMLTLMISDVPGDDPAFIGSGPTVGDDSTSDDAQQILASWKIDAPKEIDAVLGTTSGVISTNDKRLEKVENRIIAAPAQSLDAAAKKAAEIIPQLSIRQLGDAIEGEARLVAQEHAKLALQIKSEMTADASPVLLLSGGELTVTQTGDGDGIGGPNAEYALALAIALERASGIYAIACDTDGVDGAAEIAGALIGPDTLARANNAGVSANSALNNNDAHGFFAAIKRNIVTGPTLTNVNDFRAILILPSRFNRH